MTHVLHIAGNHPSRKRDADLRACEWRGVLSPMRKYFGNTSID